MLKQEELVTRVVMLSVDMEMVGSVGCEVGLGPMAAAPGGTGVIGRFGAEILSRLDHDY